MKRDTVEAFIQLMFTDGIKYGEAYNAGSGKAITIGDTVEMIEKNLFLEYCTAIGIGYKSSNKQL